MDDNEPLKTSNVIPLKTPSQLSTLWPTKPSAERVDMARKAAKKIISSFPDYGKAPPEYGVTLAENLSYLNDREIAIVMHPRTGIASKTNYLPTWEQITSLLREYEEKQHQFQPHTHYKRFESVCTEQSEPKKAFQPFPKLWEAFKEEPWLLKGKPFDALFEASRSLAMFGKESARDVLQAKVGA